jgi:hypothetical protein
MKMFLLTHGAVVVCLTMLFKFLGASAKLQRATFSFVMRLSVRMEQFGSHWTDLHEI